MADGSRWPGNSGNSALTVQRNVKGSTMAPTPGSLSTKLEPPSILVVELPNEQPVDMLAPCSVVWYSFRHSRNAVVHGEQPAEEREFRHGLSLCYNIYGI